MVKVLVSAPLNGTELPDRVEAAVCAFWPDLQLASVGGKIEGVGSDVTAFREAVWDEEIIDTVREQLLRKAAGNQTKFRLSKQAAMNGRISFPATPHGLGDVTVTLVVEEGDEWADAEALAWWICPETEDGKIVDPANRTAKPSEGGAAED